MRAKLNDNPVLQAVALGALGLLVGFMLITRMSGGPEPAAEPPATTDPATAAGAEPAAGVAVDPSAVVPPASGGAVAVAPPGAKFKAGPGLPKAVVEAYDDGKVVVLLVVRNSGIDDKRVRSIVQSLDGRNDLAVFTTRANGIVDYSRITQGAAVSRVPALIVIRPKKLTDGPMPTATVSYGFRNAASVDQAVEDALYKGRSDLPYYPK